MRFKLGVTPQQQAEEKAKIERERLYRVQQESAERDRKLGLLLRRKKRDKVIAYGILALIFAVFVTFGTMNTFFRKDVNLEEVQIIAQNAAVSFPTTGLQSYIRDNFTTWLNKHVSYSRAGDSNIAIEFVEGDLASITIDDVRPISHLIARVFFSVDITTKRANIKDKDGTEVEGLRDVKRYNFYVPIEYRYYKDNNGNTYAAGYVPIEPMSMWVLETKNVGDVEANPEYSLDGESMDTDTVESARLKVDKILDDMYRGKDTSQDLKTALGFNTNISATYIGIDEFKFYQNKNALGYNAMVKYTIKTSEGFTYQNKHYLAIRQNGSTWTINGIM